MVVPSRYKTDAIFKKEINRLNADAIILKKLANITNAFMSNVIYLEKNAEEQFRKMDSLKVSNDDKELIDRAWTLKKNVLLYCGMN